MHNKQLNNLVISYQESQPSKKEVIFTEIFEEVRKRWRKENSISHLSRRYRLDEQDVESLANFELMKSVEEYELKGAFYNFLSSRVSRRCIDLSRKLTTKNESEISLDKSINSTSEEDSRENPLIDFLIHANVEEEAIENLQRKGDQRQLIAQLLDKAPLKSRQAIQAFVESDFSYTHAAKKLGVAYNTVRRQIENVSKYYDANHSGDISDYYTVATA